MVQTISIAVLLLGLVLLLIGLWGRGWSRGGVIFLKPGTRLLIMLVAALLIFGGYWFYFDTSGTGRRSDSRVWTSTGSESRAVAQNAPAQVSAESEVPAVPVQLGSLPTDLASRAEQAQLAGNSVPETSPETAAPVAEARTEEPAPSERKVTTEAGAAESQPAVTEGSSRSSSQAQPAPQERTETREARRPTADATPTATPRPAMATTERKAPRVRKDDGRVDVCAVQVQYGVVPPHHGRHSVSGQGAVRTVTIRNQLGPGQRSEKLRLLIEGREVAKLDINASRPSVTVKLKVPRDREVSYSLVGHTDYAGYSRKPVSGGGYLLSHERLYDVRLANPWDIRGGDLFLEPES